jgi:hypothetical protein
VVGGVVTRMGAGREWTIEEGRGSGITWTVENGGLRGEGWEQVMGRDGLWELREGDTGLEWEG